MNQSFYNCFNKLQRAIILFYLPVQLALAQAQALDAKADTLLPLFYEYSDQHIILFLKDHPTVDAVEAMIRTYPRQTRVIITKHDGSQTDFVDNPVLAEKMSTVMRERTVHFAPIDVQRTAQHGIQVTLQTKSERLSLHVIPAAKPEARHSKLVDPGLHAKFSSLPLMVPLAATMAAPQSSATFDQQAFHAELKVDTPHFKAANGFYSDGFQLGGFRASKTVLPGPLPGLMGYVELADAFDSNKGVWVRFEPPLRLHIDDHRSRQEVRATMGFKGVEHGFLQGLATLKPGTSSELNSGNNAFELEMTPTQPNWALQRSVRVHFNLEKFGWVTNTTIGD